MPEDSPWFKDEFGPALGHGSQLLISGRDRPCSKKSRLCMREMLTTDGLNQKSFSMRIPPVWIHRLMVT